MENPKILMGYSDCTTIIAYLNSLGLITYYGSTIMAGFSHIKCFPQALAEYKKMLFSKEPYVLSPFLKWTEGYKDWSDVNNREQALNANRDEVGHRWINVGSKSTGEAWGGCMEVLSMMNGTPFWPNRDFFEEKVLLLETSEDKPTPKEVKYFLRNLGVQGILERINGLLIARPKSYTYEEKKELDNEVKKL